MRSDAAPLGGETGLAQQTQQIRVREQDPHRGLEAFGVVLLEAPNGPTVEIEHAEQPIAVQQGHDDFRARAGVASDVTGKSMYVGDDDGAALTRCTAAHAAAERDADASYAALKRSKHQLVAAQEVEAGPIQVRQQLVQ